MNRKGITETGVIILFIFLFLSFSGCRTSTGIFIGNTTPGSGQAPSYEDEGPPPWAPAHGYRAKHTYRYYPYHGIYFEKKTGVYFYLSDGEWHASVSLPSYIRITLNDFVTLDMNTERPYEYHSDVIKRYPPGQQKKQDKTQGQGNKKGKGK
ncbi:MAG: hypothetical protein JW944_12290 [Deltaproteobacteria bacterium]|nr:hypothetical protein [Deltaproteobacteria bacterium]